MNNNYLKNGCIGLLSFFIFISGCRKRDAPLPDNLIQFETNEQGLAANSSTLTVKLKLTRATDKDIPVSLNLSMIGLTYATDFTTIPVATNGIMAITIPGGNNEASFTITKKAGILFDGDEKIIFNIASSAAPLIIGTTKEFSVTFAELVALNSSIIIDGGGATYGNKVFIDLSANKQQSVIRSNWDLGFYTTADSFRVVLNSSSAMMAKQINKNDLNAVNATDTIGFHNEVVFNLAAPLASALPYIDYPDGDLSKTAIASISASAADNKVYIINRGSVIGNNAASRGWKKIRIIRNVSGGYTLQHADIGATTFQEIQIAKDEAFFFKYISFENRMIEVEPAKKKWDIAWTYFSNVTNFGGGEVPYLFQDIVLSNRNVSIAKVLSAVKPYLDFAETDLTAQTFSSSQTGIGSDWRSGGGPNSSPAVRTDRYYIIKDGDNNYYKIRFTSLTKNGERGYPAFEYTLVKRGG